MRKYKEWKNNGNKSLPVYDFSPPKKWTGERSQLEQEAMAHQLNFLMSGKAKKEQSGCLKLALLLPNGLKRIISYEVLNGNSIVSIGKAGWPNSKSIVVNLRNRFQIPSRQLVATAQWRLLNDTHYCKEEISELKNGIEHLIIV